MLTEKQPEYFQESINTQNPVSWSEALKPFGMKLAYCPTDMRRLAFYLNELVQLDDLFLLCYYTSTDPDELLRDPDEMGWICGSHVVILYKDQVIDPMIGYSMSVNELHLNEKYTKRIFRVVHIGCERGL